MADYLKDILRNKKIELAGLKNRFGLKNNMPGEKENDSFSDGIFIKKLSESRVNIIAEIKKYSPSRGKINEDLDVRKTAFLYSKYKSFISAISVITEPVHFKGSSDFLRMVKKTSDLPVLRKDFIFNENQVYESAAIGADCILLICSILGQKKLKRLYDTAKNLGMDVLVEVHDVRELEKALDTGARLIGINNRNLKSMEVDLNNTIEIIEYAADKELKDKIIVCESGIIDISYISDLYRKSINVFLVGSYFMQSKNLEKDLFDMEERLKKEKLI